MTSRSDRDAALHVLMAGQTRLLTNGYEKNDCRCPICHRFFWYPTNDPSLSEQALRTSYCRKAIGADCLRIFLFSSIRRRQGKLRISFYRTKLLDSAVAESHDRRSTTSNSFREGVGAFQAAHSSQLNTFQAERARADCALYQEFFIENAISPGPLDSRDPDFGGKVELIQRIQGLAPHQSHALFLQLQREGAFRPISLEACEITDSEL